MRKSTAFCSFFLILCLLFAGTLIEAMTRAPDLTANNTSRIRWVKTLGLADPALFTEAAYIRHLSQADRHMPFQEHPGALDHFPGGALIGPPDHLRP